jgi:hypothetical protein
VTLPAENQQTVEAALAQHTGFHDTLCQVNYAHKGLPCNCSLAENEAARAALRDLAAQAELTAELGEAVATWDATLSEYCDGPERDAVRALLAHLDG